MALKYSICNVFVAYNNFVSLKVFQYERFISNEELNLSKLNK